MIYPQSYKQSVEAFNANHQQAVYLASAETADYVDMYVCQNFLAYKVTKNDEGAFALEKLNSLHKERTLTAHKLSRAMPQAVAKPEVNNYRYFLYDEFEHKDVDFGDDDSDMDSLYREIKQYKSKEKIHKTKLAKAKKVLISLLPTFKRLIFTKVIDYESNSSEIVHLEDFGTEWCQTFKNMRAAEWEHFKYLTKGQYFS
ncbi:hypothetical protein WICPIJ_007366 [Wickerhamomyces pijperi]|uniref:Uncharacterized protein n=1 Tax=Wickerhamomyces pijperi TaxID=599730 RepID=A0A9P8TJC6_WICPI|nr:hypothetical protein WICPIJ_007366 [Wickerhamomyces pijperi]